MLVLSKGRGKRRSPQKSVDGRVETLAGGGGDDKAPITVSGERARRGRRSGSRHVQNSARRWWRAADDTLKEEAVVGEGKGSCYAPFKQERCPAEAD